MLSRTATRIMLVLLLSTLPPSRTAKPAPAATDLASGQAYRVSLETNLAVLAGMKSHLPIFACIGSARDGPAVDVTGKSAEEALAEIAEAHGCDIFEIGGMKVLGPRRRFELYSHSVKPDEPQWATPTTRVNMLLSGLTPVQLGMLISEYGLSCAVLNAQQRDVLARLFKHPVRVASLNLASEEGRPWRRGRIMRPLKRFPISEVVLHARVEVGPLRLYRDQAFPSVSLRAPQPESGWFYWRQSRRSCDTFGRYVANGAYIGDLDCSLSPFGRSAELDGRSRVADLVARLASETGQELYAAPCVQELTVITSACGARPIPAVLEALSIAVPCTWRKVGPAYVLCCCKVGCAGAVLMADQVDSAYDRAAAWYECAASDLFSRLDVLTRMLFKEGRPLALSPSQLEEWFKATTARRGLYFGIRDTELPISSLTTPQRAELSRRIEELREDGRGDVRGLDSYKTVGFRLSVTLAADVPGEGPVRLTSLDPPGSETLKACPITPAGHPSAKSSFDHIPPMPPGAKVELNFPLRGLLYSPAKGDTAREIVRNLRRAGLNALYLRLFHDGYAVHPGDCFPTLPGFRDRDFLEKLLDEAYGDNIKVIGVVDVLRWGEGDQKKHWLYKMPRLIDLDALQQTMLESAAAPSPYKEQSRVEANLFVYRNDAFTGEFVSPFHPSVERLLTRLLDELAAYDLDGLALDYAAVPGTEPQYPGMGRRALGYTERARLQFLRKKGADPIDLPPPGGAIPPADGTEQPVDLPAHSVLGCLHSFGTESESQGFRSETQKLWKDWVDMRRERSDTLLAGLAKHWKGARPGSPLHLIDTYSAKENVHDLKKLEGLIDARLLIFFSAMNRASEPGLPTAMLWRLQPGMPDKALYHGLQRLVDRAPPESPGLVLELPEGRERYRFLRLLERLLAKP